MSEPPRFTRNRTGIGKVASITKTVGCPPRSTVVDRRCPALAGPDVDHYNRVRLHSAIGYAPPGDKTGRTRDADVCRARSQDGGGTPTAATSPADRQGKNPPHPWSLVGGRAKLNWASETEAGSAGKRSCRGITRWAHRVDQIGSVRVRLAAPSPEAAQETSSNDRPLCLENPRPEGRNTV